MKLYESIDVFLLSLLSYEGNVSFEVIIGRNIGPCVITHSFWTSSFFGVSSQLIDRRFVFSDFPLWHSAVSWWGRLLQGFLNFFRNECWFCIRCQLFIRLCLRSGIDGRYSVVVTKTRNRPKRPKTTQNHPKPPKTTNKAIKINQNDPKPATIYPNTYSVTNDNIVTSASGERTIKSWSLSIDQAAC